MTVGSTPGRDFEFPSFKDLVRQIAEALTGLAAQGRCEPVPGYGWRLATAESLTGGGIAAVCTSRPGSSNWFDQCFGVYTVDAKINQLGLPAGSVTEDNVVSAETAEAMARGALAKSRARITVAVTGFAGSAEDDPDQRLAEPQRLPDTSNLSDGVVCFGWALLTDDGRVEARTEIWRFDGGRASVRAQTVQRALEGVLEMLAAA